MSYKIILPLLLVLTGSVGSQAAPTWLLVQDFEKKLSKTFDVDNSGSVRLENRYGEINVETWSRNQVQVDVTIRVNATSKSKADETFDRIGIAFIAGTNRAETVTAIGKGSSSGWLSSILNGDWSGSSDDFKVYYQVKMPAAAELETVAKYCDVRLPNLSGDNILDVAYGDAIAGKLTGNNRVDISYGSIRADELGRNTDLRLRYSEGTVRKADRLKYDGRYSEAEIGTVNRIDIDAGYEDIEIDKAGTIYMRGNYNDLDADEVDRIDLDGSYSDYSIGKVNVSVIARSNYGDVEVDEFGLSFEKVDISTRYADVVLRMPNGAAYNVDVSTRYGDISIDGNGSLDRRQDGSSESVKGDINGGGKARVRVDTAYGDVALR